VNAVGVSNYSKRRWRTAERALGSLVVSNQVSFSIVDQGPLNRLEPYARERGRVIIAHTPLAQGLLGGRYSAQSLPADLRARGPYFAPSMLERAAPLLAELDAIARRHGATPAQVALAWLIHKPNVIAIPGARSVAQLEENAASADIELGADEWERLRSLGKQAGFKSGRRGWKAVAAWVLGY
jgi:aryl-alcohol dehydrogenase-like predicted oxidoreductase